MLTVVPDSDTVYLTMLAWRRDRTGFHAVRDTRFGLALPESVPMSSVRRRWG